MLSDLQNDVSRVSDIFLSAISLLNSFSIVLSAVFFFNAQLIITLFFGEQWLDLVPIMQIVSLSVIFNINGRLVDCFFRSLAYVKLGFYLRVISVVITFLGICVGSQFGIYGVALAIVITNVLNIMLKLGFLSFKVQVPLWSVVKKMIVAWRPGLPILVIGVPFLILHPHLLMYNLLFAILFGMLVIVEFLFYPRFIGIVYQQRVYPLVCSLKCKFIRK